VSVRVEIERLLVEGVRLTAGERLALRSEIEDELEALLRERVPAWPLDGAAVRRVVAEPAPRASAPGVGAPIAGAIHDGIHRVVGR
jgi:hypothetical protein